MEVFCILGIEYIQGTCLISIPKIYGVYDNVEKALEEKRNLSLKGFDKLSISTMKIN